MFSSEDGRQENVRVEDLTHFGREKNEQLLDQESEPHGQGDSNLPPCRERRQKTGFRGTVTTSGGALELKYPIRGRENEAGHLRPGISEGRRSQRCYPPGPQRGPRNPCTSTTICHICTIKGQCKSEGSRDITSRLNDPGQDNSRSQQGAFPEPAIDLIY